MCIVQFLPVEDRNVNMLCSFAVEGEPLSVALFIWSQFRTYQLHRVLTQCLDYQIEKTTFKNNLS